MAGASYAAEPSGASRVGFATSEGPVPGFLKVGFGSMEREIMAETTAKTSKPRKAAAKRKAAPRKAASPAPRTHRDEAKSRFNAALEEARAGAVALGAEARERAGSYTAQARTKSDDWTSEAKTRALELARDGKGKASEALSGLGRVVGDTAPTIDERLGAPYGDYARSASKTLQTTASKLEQKSVEQLGEDAREMVRKSPAAAVGLAALAGFLLARLFRR